MLACEMTSLVRTTATVDSFLPRGRDNSALDSAPSSSSVFDLPLERKQACESIVRRYLERVSDTRAYQSSPAHAASLLAVGHGASPCTTPSTTPTTVPSKRPFVHFSNDDIAMADRRSSRRLAQNATTQPAALAPQHSRGTRANARKDDAGDGDAAPPPSLRSHSRTASIENTRGPCGRSTRTSAANTRSQPARTSGRSQPARSAAVTSAATRSRRRLPSSDSEDDDSNIDLADDDDVEASQDSEEEDEEEEEEEEEEEPAPKKPSRAVPAPARQVQRLARRSVRAPASDEDAPGETDDGMDIDERLPVATAGTLRRKAAIESDDDEDAEGEPDDEDMGVVLTSRAKQVPVPKIVAPESDDEDDEDDMDDDDEDEDEDAEGEEVDDEEEDDDDDMDSGGLGTTPDLSRPDTPDLSKLTIRQRRKYIPDGDPYREEFQELPDDFGSNKKAVPLTAAEQATRRAEMARRRKNQSEQRREEEKMETINRLLKRQATKVNRRNQKQFDDDTAADEAVEAGSPVQTDPPTMLRWVSGQNGNVLGVPQTWLDGPAGEAYREQGVAWRRRGGKMTGLVEELPDEIMADA
ncbi:hypothetical protein DRE_03167 [Drechslerella stenobrocha 248]|uniref:INO80 complex subunit B-like conserved region domain-containing protein n=1 Tax=Drechslerella stenobrocha 248 TaxID=1043628 RepID=W7I550_9PEZI|nr:hypothetical protein DRE_03167 [Drechslerella stenobrocha 248]